MAWILKIGLKASSVKLTTWHLATLTKTRRGETVSDLKFAELARQEMALTGRLSDFKKICEENGVDFKDRIEDVIFNVENEDEGE